VVNTALTVTLVATCAVAAWFDVRENRLPNWLTVSAFVVALGLRAGLGWGELGTGALGAGITFVLALPFFLVGGAGGGDVKFLTAVGAYLGPGRLPTALFVMAIVGGLMAVVAILRRGALTEVWANLQTLRSTFGSETFTGWRGRESDAALTLDTPGAITVPYGVAIAAGALAGWFL
jgi:prepilin peptidase CpaA